MEFISADEFLKQSKEIQEVFLAWWKPSIGDIFLIEKTTSFSGDKHNFIECFLTGFEVADLTEIERKRIICPLFTEGQLRKFIEDKASIELEIVRYSSKDRCNEIGFYDMKECGDYPRYKVDETDLFQAYWKVACEIAKEEVENEIRKR